MSRLSRTGLRRTPADRSEGAHPPDHALPVSTCDPTAQISDELILYTAEQAAGLLQVRPSWLRRKAAARAVPCRHVGKHLRFSRADVDAIADASAWPQRDDRPHRR